MKTLRKKFEKIMGEMYQSLLEDGVLCVPIIYPAVSRNACRFRFTIMATHSISDLDYAIACLEKAAIKAGHVPQIQTIDLKKAA